MGKLTGKIALITGGSEGMGFDTAEEFIREGAFVFITGRRPAELDKAVAKLGKDCSGIRADAGSLTDLDRVYATIREQKGRLDVLFCNAGIYGQAPHDQVTEEFFDRHFDINVKGLSFTVQKALPLMTGGGSVILNASFIAKKGFPQMIVYGATKAAVRSFARTFTAELKGSGVRVNVLSPGPIATPGFSTATGHSEEIKAFVSGSVPLQRMGTGLEVAKAAVFLSCDDSSYVAGANLLVDGGMDAV